jgi:serine protease Do
MLKYCLSALLCAAVAASGATVQLREKASVTGTILAEKHDTIVVDLGYTVLAIPRNQVVKILDDQVAPEKATSGKAPKSSTKPPVTTEKGYKTMFQTSATPPKERSVRELVSILGESVVQVRTPGGLGSGFFINEDGYLITNFHVTEGETQISIEVFHSRGGELERKVYKNVRIVALNKFADLALLKVDDKDAPKFVPVALGDSESLAVGERVFAIGSPLGLERTVTEGIISTKTRQFQGDLYLQTTAQINPGNSGGPLFNMRGEVIGVTNMKITFGEGLGFAIPIEQVKFFLIHRDSFAYDNDNPSNAYRYLEPPSRAKKVAAK